MKAKQEKLGRSAAVKGTMLHAHLNWASARIPGVASALKARLDEDACALVAGGFLDTDWVPFRSVIQIDRAIAETVGAPPEQVFRDLGRHSAQLNLAGVYKSFVVDEPHRFFDRASSLHERFQSFGHCRYERLGERSGRITLDGYDEYSPVYCASAPGYYEEALRMMHVPGPIRVTETNCQCAGDPACIYELSW